SLSTPLFCTLPPPSHTSTPSLHDALPISSGLVGSLESPGAVCLVAIADPGFGKGQQRRVLLRHLCAKACDAAGAPPHRFALRQEMREEQDGVLWHVAFQEIGHEARRRRVAAAEADVLLKLGKSFEHLACLGVANARRHLVLWLGMNGSLVTCV